MHLPDENGDVRATRLPDPRVLDDVVYRIVSLGFGLLTLVLISGAMWAQYVYQSWWSWDPKETSALVAWLVYAAYLHGRLQRGWGGRTSAWLAIAGFAAVLFCFAGTNLMPHSYHSYGSPQAEASRSLGGWGGLPPLEAGLTKTFLVLYVVSALAHLGAGPARLRRVGAFGVAATWAGFALQTAALVARTVTAGRLTFATGYEFSLWFVWAIVLCYIILERLRGYRLVGVFALPIALLVCMYAYLWFPDKGVQPLMPALQSKFWLHVHVAIAIAAYGCLALAAATAGLYLLASKHGGGPSAAAGSEEPSGACAPDAEAPAARLEESRGRPV